MTKLLKVDIIITYIRLILLWCLFHPSGYPLVLSGIGDSGTEILFLFRLWLWVFNLEAYQLQNVWIFLNTLSLGKGESGVLLPVCRFSLMDLVVLLQSYMQYNLGWVCLLWSLLQVSLFFLLPPSSSLLLLRRTTVYSPCFAVAKLLSGLFLSDLGCGHSLVVVFFKHGRLHYDHSLFS